MAKCISLAVSSVILLIRISAFLRTSDAVHSWGHWSHFSHCNATCDGVQFRSRDCIRHALGTHISTGKPDSARHCPHHHDNTSTISGTAEIQTHVCSGHCPVRLWSQWSGWTDCSTTCDIGERFRGRHCLTGNDCIGEVFQQETCNITRCLHIVDGGWGEWENWAPCSTTCGLGYNVKYRHCDSPAPHDGGSDCVGKHNQIRVCPLVHCPVDGGWGNYTIASCTVTCGAGVLVLQRPCNDPPPQYNGKDCVGSSTKLEKCVKDPCVIDGSWSEWSNDSVCKVVCGDGHLRRTRTCTNPAPQFGGTECVGDAVDKVRVCNNGPCPSDIKVCDKALIQRITVQARQARVAQPIKTSTSLVDSTTLSTTLSTTSSTTTPTTPSSTTSTTPSSTTSTTPSSTTSTTPSSTTSTTSSTTTSTTSSTTTSTAPSTTTSTTHPTTTSTTPSTTTSTTPSTTPSNTSATSSTTPSTTASTTISTTHSSTTSTTPSTTSSTTSTTSSTTPSNTPSTTLTNTSSITASGKCSPDSITNGVGIVETYCSVPQDRSKWRLGIKIHGNCEMIPLYTPVGSSDNGVHVKEYGVMVDCFVNRLQMVSWSCRNEILMNSFNLTDVHTSVYMILFES